MVKIPSPAKRSCWICRALATLEGEGYLDAEEMTGARKVLSAAALTYVAAALTAVLQLLRLLALSGRGRRRS